MRRALLIAALLLAPPAAAQETVPDTSTATEAGDDSTSRRRQVRPLFADTTVLRATLRADLRRLFNDRDTVNPGRHAGVLSFIDSAGQTVMLPVELSTRGHYRRQFGNCSVPPIRVRFAREAVRGTLFRGQRSLKLVTHCRNLAQYDSYVVEEHLIYRTLNILTDTSFRTRLMRLAWVDDRDTTKREEHWAFFIEDDGDLGRRIGGEPLDQKGATLRFVGDRVDFVTLFEYFIGNTDWSVPALHNIRLFNLGVGGYTIVPYDFDFSGVLLTRYAGPDKRLPIKSVRERLYRGICRTPEQMAPVVARFVAARPAIWKLYESAPLEEKRRKQALSFYEDFYDTIGRHSVFARALSRQCEPA